MKTNSPTATLFSLGYPYSEYIKEIKNTKNYKYYMPLVSSSKLTYWDIDLKSIELSTIRVMYSAILELFIRDNTTEMFYFIFKDYVSKIFSDDDSILYRDGVGNNIFHYDAIHGESRVNEYRKISELHNLDTTSEIGIDTNAFSIDILFDENYNGIKVLDVIKAN